MIMCINDINDKTVKYFTNMCVCVSNADLFSQYLSLCFFVLLQFNESVYVLKVISRFISPKCLNTVALSCAVIHKYK